MIARPDDGLPAVRTAAGPLVLDPRRIAVVLVGGIAVLNVLNAAVIVANPWETSTGTWLTLLAESNPATWFSSAQLACVAVLFALLGRERPDRRSWLAAAAVVLVLAIDEVAMFHERLDSVFGTDGIEHYGWAVPGAVLVAATGWLALRWFRALSPALRWHLTAALGVYVAGGLVAEVLSGVWQTAVGEDRLWLVLVTIEENLELLGVAIALLALVAEARRAGLEVAVRFDQREGS